MFRSLLLAVLVSCCLSVEAQMLAPNTNTKADVYSVLTETIPAKIHATTGNESGVSTAKPMTTGIKPPMKSGAGTCYWSNYLRPSIKLRYV